jgi:integrase
MGPASRVSLGGTLDGHPGIKQSTEILNRSTLNRALRALVSVIPDTRLLIFTTKASALREWEPLRKTINRESATPRTVAELVTHYRQTELQDDSDKAFSTRTAYEVYFRNWIVPAWGEPAGCFDSRGNQNLLTELDGPYRVMTFLAAVTGLRVSELSALKSQDVHFDSGEIHLTRAIVCQHIGTLKTAASQKPVPMDAGLAAAPLDWRAHCPYNQDMDFVFTSGEKRGTQPL